MNHAAHRTDALSAGKMNLNCCGTQPIPHDSYIDPEHAHLLLGAGEAKMMRETEDGSLEEVDCKLKPGDTQKFYFAETDLPPFNKPNTPKYDQPKVDKNGSQVKDKAEDAVEAGRRPAMPSESNAIELLDLWIGCLEIQ